MLYLYNGLVVKRNHILIHGTTWINLEKFRLSDGIQSYEIAHDPVRMKCSEQGTL